MKFTYASIAITVATACVRKKCMRTQEMHAYTRNACVRKKCMCTQELHAYARNACIRKKYSTRCLQCNLVVRLGFCEWLLSEGCVWFVRVSLWYEGPSKRICARTSCNPESTQDGNANEGIVPDLCFLASAINGFYTRRMRSKTRSIRSNYALS